MSPDDTDESNVTDRAEHGDDAVRSPPAPEDDTGDSDETAAAESTETRGDLPPVLDVRDALDRIERDADSDVGSELDRIRSLLDQYEEREEGAGSRSSLVDDIDGVVVSMRERLSGDADRDVEAIENRLQTYRDAESDASQSLAVSGAELRDGGGERIRSIDGYGAATATLDATLVNRGDGRDGLLRLSFYDDDGAVRRVVSRASALAPDEHRSVQHQVVVPEEARYYDATALDSTALDATDVSDGDA